MDNILYIDDERINLEVFKVSFFEEFNIFTASSTKEAYTILKENTIKVVITDQRMPDETGIEFINRVHKIFSNTVFMILSSFADFEVVHAAITSGNVYRFMLKPWKEEEILVDVGNAIEKYDLNLQNKKLVSDLKIQNDLLKTLKQKLEAENVYLRDEIKEAKDFENIITNDDNFKAVLANISQIANSDASVLIYGETGTGKELVARAIHNLSIRKQNPIICVNCAAIPESLFESELFGHEKGAFTGALTQRKGKFELANNGTLFLDEIGEIPVVLQSKLLRAIQEGEIERVGGSKPVKLNIRIVSATNKNLNQEIEKGQFRSDLYYRLNVCPINIPPLRERKEDIPLLVNYFINRYNKKDNKQVKSITKKALEQLKIYSWPGNIRELENVIERAVIISNSDSLNIEGFKNTGIIKQNSEIKTLAEIEKIYILEMLHKTSWKIGGNNGAAELLGLNRTTLLARMKKLNIKKAS